MNTGKEKTEAKIIHGMEDCDVMVCVECLSVDVSGSILGSTAAPPAKSSRAESQHQQTAAAPRAPAPPPDPRDRTHPIEDSQRSHPCRGPVRDRVAPLSLNPMSPTTPSTPGMPRPHTTAK